MRIWELPVCSCRVYYLPLLKFFRVSIELCKPVRFNAAGLQRWKTPPSKLHFSPDTSRPVPWTNTYKPTEKVRRRRTQKYKIRRQGMYTATENSNGVSASPTANTHQDHRQRDSTVQWVVEVTREVLPQKKPPSSVRQRVAGITKVHAIESQPNLQLTIAIGFRGYDI